MSYPQCGEDSAQPLVARRPWTVLVGCILAWVGGAFGVLSGAYSLTLDEGSQFIDDLPDDVDRADALATIQLNASMLLGWCLIVVVMAFLAFRGARWAAITLLVMAGVVSLVALLNLLLAGSVTGLPGLVWSVGSAVLIYRTKASKDWYDAHAAAR